VTDSDTQIPAQKFGVIKKTNRNWSILPLDIVSAPVGCCVDLIVVGSAAPQLGPFFFFFAPVWAICYCSALVGPPHILELFRKLYFHRFNYWET